jgi:DNA polymerase-3 subunit chi
MGAVNFYHLTRSPPEVALARIAARALEQGWTVEVRVSEAARADWLDQQLWVLGNDGFLPHGLAGGPHDALQPILIVAGDGGLGRDCLMSLDGAALAPAEIATAERTWILFDGADPGAVETARNQWRCVTDAGLGAAYWSEESGRWQMVMERQARPPEGAAGV